MRHGGPIDSDVVFIIELEELLFGELRAIVRDNGVWDSKAMDDVKEEQHGLLGLDHGDRSRVYPLFKLVYGDKQVCIAPGRPLERSNQIEPLDHEWPHEWPGGSVEHSIDTLHRCAQSVQHRLLWSTSRSPIEMHFRLGS